VMLFIAAASVSDDDVIRRTAWCRPNACVSSRDLSVECDGQLQTNAPIIQDSIYGFSLLLSSLTRAMKYGTPETNLFVFLYS